MNSQITQRLLDGIEDTESYCYRDTRKGSCNSSDCRLVSVVSGILLTCRVTGLMGPEVNPEGA